MNSQYVNLYVCYYNILIIPQFDKKSSLYKISTEKFSVENIITSPSPWESGISKRSMEVPHIDMNRAEGKIYDWSARRKRGIFMSIHWSKELTNRRIERDLPTGDIVFIYVAKSRK